MHYPALVAQRLTTDSITLDAGLRPVGIERARTRWTDVSNNVLRIPKEESSKNKDNRTVTLTDRTITALSRWLDEREHTLNTATLIYSGSTGSGTRTSTTR